jgi:hypothetical protein
MMAYIRPCELANMPVSAALVPGSCCRLGPHTAEGGFPVGASPAGRLARANQSAFEGCIRLDIALANGAEVIAIGVEHLSHFVLHAGAFARGQSQYAARAMAPPMAVFKLRAAITALGETPVMAIRSTIAPMTAATKIR